MKRCKSRLAFPILLLGAFLGAGRPALAYEKDTHYFLTFAIARCCGFTGDDARLIASADWAQDTNSTTVAGFGGTAAQRNINRIWHALYGDLQNANNKNQRAARRVALWQRAGAANGRAQLINLGQFLHFTQDEFAHAGYGSVIGHALPTFFGNDPDSLKDTTDVRGMVNRSVERLCAAKAGVYAAEVAGTDGSLDLRLRPALRQMIGQTQRDLKDLITRLIDNSKVDWKQFSGFELTVMGKQVLANNIESIRGYLRNRLKLGGNENIPTELPLKYNGDGEEVAAGGGDPRIDSDVRYARLTQSTGGTSSPEFGLTLQNQGSVGSVPSGQTIVVFDPARVPVDESEPVDVSLFVLGQNGAPVSSLSPGAMQDDALTVGVTALPPGAMAWATIGLDDADASNNQRLTPVGSSPPTHVYTLDGGGWVAAPGECSPFRLHLVGVSEISNPNAFRATGGSLGGLSAYNFRTALQIDSIRFASLEGSLSGSDLSATGLGTALVNGSLTNIFFRAARTAGIITLEIRRDSAAGEILVGGTGLAGRSALTETITPL